MPQKNGSAKKKRRVAKLATIDANYFLRQWRQECFAADEANDANSESAVDAESVQDSFHVDFPKRVFSTSIVDFHTHSTCSDGTLSPSQLVERAHRNGVQILSLTDHDTMAGVEEAIAAGKKYGVRIIPGVEISAYLPNENASSSELNNRSSVHILGYFGLGGISHSKEFHSFLFQIREGRRRRVRSMVDKLRQLHVHIDFHRVLEIAGEGVAPGRVHVAKALLESGYVSNMQHAFTKYLKDGGPAYAIGEEASAKRAIQMIKMAGGVSVLAHPWSTKNVTNLIQKLHKYGLHGIEYFRHSRKSPMFGDLADACQLLKIGGSDFHGKKDVDEVDIGQINLPSIMAKTFIEMAQPIWKIAIVDIIREFVETKSSYNLDQTAKSSDGNEFFGQWGMIEIQNGKLILSEFISMHDKCVIKEEAARFGLVCNYHRIDDVESMVLS